MIRTEEFPVIDNYMPNTEGKFQKTEPRESVDWPLLSMMTLANTEETSFFSSISFYVIPGWTCTVPTARSSSARDILEPRSGTLL